MFLNPTEQAVSEEYLEQGYIIRPVANVEALIWLKNNLCNYLVLVRRRCLIVSRL